MTAYVHVLKEKHELLNNQMDPKQNQLLLNIADIKLAVHDMQTITKIEYKDLILLQLIKASRSERKL